MFVYRLSSFPQTGACECMGLTVNWYLAKIVVKSTNINHKGLQWTANEYAEERRICKDLISKNKNVDILNSASRILQCWSYWENQAEPGRGDNAQITDFAQTRRRC